MITWIVLRAAGIGAYLMLFLSVAWGLASTTSIVTSRVAKPTSILFHQFVSTVALVLLGVHIGGLLLDRFMPFHLLDVLLPMRTSFRPLAVGSGIVALYAMVIVLVTSWTRRWIRPKLWRAIHLIATPAFTLALIHGVLTGTDTTRPWMFAIYLATGITTLFLVIVRGLTEGYRPARREHAPAARAIVESVTRPLQVSRST